MNRSVNYFAKNDDFEESSFLNEVIDNPDLISELKNYKVDRGEKYSIEDVSNFAISNSAVTDARKKFKNGINLDTNITINLDFINPESAEKFIEKGWDDEKQMYYNLVYSLKRISNYGSKRTKNSNTVTYKDKTVIIQAITGDGVSVSGYEQSRYTSIYLCNINLKPITLTDNILLNYGYTESDFNVGLIIIKDEGYIITILETMRLYKYLHQLQNFYFTLHQQELVVNIK